MSLSILDQAILKTVCYADIFDYPLTTGEICRYLISPKRFSQLNIKRRINYLAKTLMATKKDFYFLKGRQNLVARRQERQIWSQEKFRIAQETTWFLKYLPWIQAVLITGALAWDNSPQDDDIDWLVITVPNRLWLTRFFLNFSLQILRKRRFPGQTQVRNKICLNLFITENSLALLPSQRNLFTAHEIIQARLLWGRKRIVGLFHRANSWVKNYLANIDLIGLSQPDLGKSTFELARKQVSFLRGLLDQFLYFLEKLAFVIQKQYMKPRRTKELVHFERAFFHPTDIGSLVMANYQKRIAKFILSEKNFHRNQSIIDQERI